MEVGTKALGRGNKEESLEFFNKAYQLYSLFWGINMKIVELSKSELKKISGGGRLAYLLGKYKVDSYLGSMVGDDTFGNTIRKELEKVGVHTEYMEIAYEKRTSLSYILLNEKEKKRTILNINKEKLLMKKTEFPMDPDLVLVDSFDYGASLSAFNKYANKITIIDAKMANSETIELCKYAKYIIASKDFASYVSGVKIDFNNPNSLVNCYSALLNKFPNRNIVVTLGDKGAMYLMDNQIKVMPGLKVNEVDATGAKDIFCGSFAYALLKGYDIEKTVTFANIASGLSVVKIGGRSSIPEYDEIMKYFLQKYPDEGTIQKETPPVIATEAGM
jgi:sugar/nucleoside kinase (ribokinase family)